MSCGDDAGTRCVAARSRIGWVAIVLVVVVVAGVGMWLARKPGCGSTCGAVPPVDKAQPSPSASSEATNGAMRELTAEEVAGVRGHEDRLREIARQTTALYREMAEARKVASESPEETRVREETEALRVRYEQAFNGVAGVSELREKGAALRLERDAVLASNVTLRAAIGPLTPPDEALRAKLRATDARVGELDDAIGGVNRQIEALKDAALAADVGMAEMRRRLVELEHLAELRRGESPRLAELQSRAALLKEEARTISEAVAGIRARGVMPGAVGDAGTR